MTENTQTKRNVMEPFLFIKEKDVIDNTIEIRYPSSENNNEEKNHSIKVAITDMKDIILSPSLKYPGTYKVIMGNIKLSSNDITLTDKLGRAIIGSLIFNPNKNKFECMLDLYNLQLIGGSKKAQIRAIKHYLRDVLDENIEITKLLSYKKYDGFKLKIKVMMKLYGKVLIPINLGFLLDADDNKVWLKYIQHNGLSYKLKDLYKVLLEKTIRG